MKYLISSSLIILVLHISYGQTTNELENITVEILEITNKYNKTWETLDMNQVAQFHSDSSFRYYRNMELSVASNEEFRNIYPQYFIRTKSWKLETYDPVVQVLSSNVAVIGFTGKAELITKDEKVLDIGTGAYTYVWKKINDEWKIAHIHESAK